MARPFVIRQFCKNNCGNRIKTKRNIFCSNKCRGIVHPQIPKGYKFGKRKSSPHTIEHNKNIGNANRGKKKIGHIAWNKGIMGLKQIRSPEGKISFREKMKKAISGEKHWNWKGGTTFIYEKIRRTTEYKLWRKSVFERDNYTCKNCKIKGGILNADHIKPFALYPELRFAVDNGRTLCVTCHRKTDTYGWKIYHYKCAEHCGIPLPTVCSRN